MAGSKLELETFVIHVGYEAVLQSFMKAFQKIGVCSSKNGWFFPARLLWISDSGGHFPTVLVSGVQAGFCLSLLISMFCIFSTF